MNKIKDNLIETMGQRGMNPLDILIYLERLGLV